MNSIEVSEIINNSPITITFHPETKGIYLSLMNRFEIIPKKIAAELLRHLNAFYEVHKQSDLDIFNHQMQRQWVEMIEEENRRCKSQKGKIKKETSGYIYFLQTKEYVKIGKTTKAADKRCLKISPKLPTKSHLLGSIKVIDINRAESLLHKLFDSSRCNGEWFLIDKKTVLLGMKHGFGLPELEKLIFTGETE